MSDATALIVWTEAEFNSHLLAAIPRLRSYCAALTKNPDAATDLVQDVMVRALRARARFAPGTNLGAWLTTIARNHWYSGVRRRWRMQPMPEGLAERQPVSANQVDALMAKDVEAALDVLRPDVRDALVAVAVDGLTYEEAADALGIEIGTIKRRVSRGRDQLEAYFGGVQ